MSSMKLLSLLTVGIVLITQAFACNYETPIPKYAKLTTPKKTLSIPKAYGICVAPNGNFAVTSLTGKVYLYYGCGKLMKVIDLHKQLGGHKHLPGCAFTDRNLYVATNTGKKVYELSTTGKFTRVFATGQTFFRIEACQDRVFVTTSGSKLLFIYDTNGRKIRQFAIPNGYARGVIVGIDNKIYVANGDKKQVLTYTLEGKAVEVMTKKEIISFADGLAMYCRRA